MGKVVQAVVAVALVASGNAWAVAIGRSMIASAIIGTISRALTKKPSASGSTMSAQGRMETVRQPLGPWQVVYGRCRVGGNLTFFETTTDNQTALMIVTLAGHPVSAIRDIYFNDVSTKDYAAAGVVGNATGKFSGYSTIIRSDGTEGASQPFTALAARGLSWTSSHLQRDRAKVHTTHLFSNDVWATGLPQVSAVINGVKDIYDPRLGSPSTSRWSNNPALCIAHYITASFGLDADYAAEIDEATLIASANVCDERVTLSGNRTATVASVSDANDWIELSPDQPHADWGDGVRFSTGSPGSLPGGLVGGVTYYAIPLYEGDGTTGQIIQLATTYANAMAGTAMTLSSAAGSGTTTLTYYDEPRFRLNGAFALTEKPQVILERMLMAMAGKLVNSGGVWFIYAGAYTTPTLTLDEDDFAGPIDLQTNLSRRDNANRVKGTFVDPSSRYQPVDFPPVTSATYLAEDGGDPVFRDLDLTAFVTSGTQAQRLAKIDLISSRLGLTVRTRFNLSGFRMLTGSTVLLTHAQMGWSAKPFEVANCTLVIGQDGKMEVDAVLRETDSAVYDWSTSEEQLATLAPNTNLQDPSTVSAPTGVTAASGTAQLLLQGDGTVVPRIQLNWAAPADANVKRYELQFALASGSPQDWRDVPPVVAPANNGFLMPVKDGLSYDCRVRVITAFGVASNWAYVYDHTVVGKTEVPSDVTGFSAAQSGGLVVFGANESPDADLDAIEIRLNDEGVTDYDTASPLTNILRGQTATSAAIPPGTWELLAKNRDTSGNYSATAARVTLTVTADGYTDITAQESAVDWQGALTNMVKHWTGVITPQSQSLASALGWEVFDEFVPNAYADCYFEAPVIDKSIDASARIYADIISTLGPGETTGLANPALEIDTKTTAGSYDGFETWQIGSVNFRYLKGRIYVDTTVGKPVISGFNLQIDAPSREEAGTYTTPGGGSVAVTFANQFHTTPVLQVTPQGAGDVSASYASLTSTGFTGYFKTAGAAGAGTASYTATGA